MVEIPAEHLVGLGGLCGTIQEDSCQELEFRGDGENLYDRRSTQRVRGTSPGSAVLTGEASSQVRKDLAYFQIQEIVFHLSILLQRPYHH